MAWTYSGDPSSSAKDAVRFLIGDTNSTNQLLQDAEISYLLNLYNQAPMNAAIRACETIMAKYSRLADESAGQVSISFSQRAKGYSSMLANLKTRLYSEDCGIIAGGISVSDKTRVQLNSDRVKPEFNKHMFENDQIAPWVAPLTGGKNDGLEK